MKNHWNDGDAAVFADDPLGLRVYSSRLLGSDPALVLHGGGNTSVKRRERTFFGDEEEILHVKGSGWDLGTIEKAGFAPVRMDVLLRLSEMESLSDADMVVQQRLGMLDPSAPDPSIEAILHAILPFRFVDHTHADAVIALTNNDAGEQRVRELYGDRVIIVPYVMPGFILARTVRDLIRGRDLSGVEGMILMNHGIFTFADDARTSYDRMIAMVSEAESFLAGMAGAAPPLPEVGPASRDDLESLAAIRRGVARHRGSAVLVRWDRSPEAVAFASRPDVEAVATRGPLTPDHVIRTKRIPVVIGDDPAGAIDRFAADYAAYFERHREGDLTMLDPAPRWAVWKGKGTLAFGATEKEAGVIADIVAHTFPTIALSESVGGWRSLSEAELFAIEYWDLEQAKLKLAGRRPPFAGKVAIVTGAAAGIGFACAEALAREGAKVVGLDLSPEIGDGMASIGGVGIVVNLTSEEQTREAIEGVVRDFGGIDIVVSNAGIFTAGQFLEDLDAANWEKSMAVNLTSHQRLLKFTIPFLKAGCDPAVVLVGSRNVNAPGAGAASYSCAKAGLTQLCRVAALELAPHGVRCNIIHPDAVFDTKLWTPEALQRSAERYGLTVEEYKTRNLMKTEIKSADVGRMVAAMASPLFGKTTGAQIPVDGGNDRVI